MGKHFFSLWVIIHFTFQLSYAQKGTGLNMNHSGSNSCRSGIALGGIGTGSLELRKNGQFYNWSIMNNWPVFTGKPLLIRSFPNNSDHDSYLFFLVRYRVEGEKPRIKLLQINDGLSEAGLESITYYYPWMSAVEHIEYNGTFPFVSMKFTDQEMPFDITMQAFSPFIPHNVKNSSLPGVYFNFSIESHSSKPVEVMLIASLRNLTGYDELNKYFVSEWMEGNGFNGFSMSCEGMDTTRSSWGQMGLFTTAPNHSYYLGWEHKHPYYEKLLVNPRFENINDTENRNIVLEGVKQGRKAVNNDQRCFSSLGFDARLGKGETMNANVLLAWNFPNLYGAFAEKEALGCLDYSLNQKITKIQGHYYSNFFNTAGEVAAYMTSKRDSLYTASRSFLDHFYASDIDQVVLDQINSQFNTFISSSTLTKAGKFAIREGLTPSQQWGPNATIDVSLYGSASTIALFPELQKSLMSAHKDLQTPAGEINHGLGSDLDYTQNGTWGVYHRVDLVPNYIQLVLRDFLWTSDQDYLMEMWPSIVKGLEYILNERDKDKDLMPDMEGIMCSYDNFPMYGLASYIQSQWLAAMAMTHQAAQLMNDQKTMNLAAEILEQGKILMEEKLWNGSYYALSNDVQGQHGVDDGILTDQIIGQWIAHQAGIGYLFPKAHIDKSLETIMKHSYIDGFGLRNCSWPQHPDLFPIHESDLWVDQANTCWSGVELGFAGLLLYEGKEAEALKVIKTVDERYRKAGLYWDHQEFGGHYYRPLSAWSIINGYLGLGVNNGTYRFSPKTDNNQFKVFFSYGNGMAYYNKLSKSKTQIEVVSGNMVLRALILDADQMGAKSPNVYLNGEKLNVDKSLVDKQWHFQLKRQIMVKEGENIVIE